MKQLAALLPLGLGRQGGARQELVQLQAEVVEASLQARGITLRSGAVLPAPPRRVTTAPSLPTPTRCGGSWWLHWLRTSCCAPSRRTRSGLLGRTERGLGSKEAGETGDIA